MHHCETVIIRMAGLFVAGALQAGPMAGRLMAVIFAMAGPVRVGPLVPPRVGHHKPGPFMAGPNAVMYFA